MKALLLKEHNNLVYVDTPIPECSINDLLVRIKACAICGSDVRGIDGSTGRRIPPIIMGHEASGVVVRVGENVTHFKTGDRITFDSTIFCGECGYCKQGQVNLCDNRRVLGVSCDEYRQNGAFAEYVVIPQHIAYHLPADLSFEDAAMVEPVSIALHAVRLAEVATHDTVLVYGSGVIGLIAVQLLRLCGCKKIIAVDLDRSRLEMAIRLGATDFVDVNTSDPVKTVRNLTDDKGIDVVIELVGISKTLCTAISCLRKGGRLIQVGNFSPTVEIPLHQLVTRQLTISGSCASAGEYPDSLKLLAKKSIDVGALVSAVAPLNEGIEWFNRLYKGEPGLMKVILTP